MSQAAIPPAEERFFSGALPRIRVYMLVIAGLATAVGLVVFGIGVGLGLLAGCAIAYVNFHWLKQVVAGVAERTVGEGKSQSSKGLVFRFGLRYLLIAGGAYAIFRVSPASLWGLLAGLFLPVAAILCEAGYELAVALRRGF